jgi:Tfp pilus assembly protein PilF
MAGDAKSGMAWELYHRSCQLQAQGDLELAADLCRKSIELHPTAEAHTSLAWTYHQQGRTQDAISECRRAIEVDDTLGNPYNDIGAYLIELGRPEESIDWLLKATHAVRYDSYHFPWYNLGRAYAAMETYGKALECFVHALEIEPEYRPAEEALSKVKRLIQ